MKNPEVLPAKFLQLYDNLSVLFSLFLLRFELLGNLFLLLFELALILVGDLISGFHALDLSLHLVKIFDVAFDFLLFFCLELFDVEIRVVLVLLLRLR